MVSLIMVCVETFSKTVPLAALEERKSTESRNWEGSMVDLEQMESIISNRTTVLLTKKKGRRKLRG